MLNCSTLKVVKKPAGLPDPLGDAGSKCLNTWLSNAKLTPGPGACAGKTVGGKAEPPNTESKGNQMLSSCFFPRSNNLSLPPAQRNESDLNWTKPLLVEFHASGTVSFHTPTSLSSMGPLDGAASENGNARVSQAAERQKKPRIGRHSACEMWVSTATTVKGWLENFHRYLSSADNEIL